MRLPVLDAVVLGLTCRVVLHHPGVVCGRPDAGNPGVELRGEAVP